MTKKTVHKKHQNKENAKSLCFVFPVIFIQLFQESETVYLHNHQYDRSAFRQNLLACRSSKIAAHKNSKIGNLASKTLGGQST